jgi:hypothetical protein
LKAGAKVKAAKTAKLETEKRKRKRKTDPTPKSRDIEEEDEAMDEPPDADNHAAPRSPSLVTKRLQELERQTTDEDNHRIKEVQLVAADIQAKMPVKVRGRLKLRATMVVR